MAVLCISRQFGAGGKTLGESVAKRLGYEFMDECMLDQLAEKADVWLDSPAPSNGDLHERLTAVLGAFCPVDFVERILGDQPQPANEQKHLESLARIIRELAAIGNVVLLGRGGQFILRHNPDTIKVLLVASQEHRLEFLVRHYQLSEADAKRLINEADRKRGRFLNNFYPGEPDEASLYHLVLNTSKLTLATAEDQVVSLVQRMFE